MITLKSRVVTPLGDSKFNNDYLSSPSSSPFSNRLYFTGVGQRPSSSSSLYAKGRLLGSSSVERLNRSESPPPAFRGGSSWDLRSSSPMRRPRNPSVDRLRPRIDRHPSYRSISRDELSSIDSSSSIGSNLLTSSTMERRNMIISNFNRSLPPTGLSSSTLISPHHHHPNLHPRSNFAASRNNLPSTSTSSSRPWPSSALDYFRPRIRDRPSLASIKSSIKGRPVKPSEPSSRYVKPPSTSNNSSLRLSRYRNVIKFRECHIDEPLNKRKASISWDLPLEPISSSSSYNSKSSQNESSQGSQSPNSRLSSPEKVAIKKTTGKTEDDNAMNDAKDSDLHALKWSSNSSLRRQNSVSRSNQQSPKLKVPKLEITPDSVMNETTPDVIELPKPVSPLRVHFEVSISRLEFIPVPDQTNQENNSFEVNVVLPLKSKSKSSDPLMSQSQSQSVVNNKPNLTKKQADDNFNKPTSKTNASALSPTTPNSSSPRMLPPSPPPQPPPLNVPILPINETEKCSKTSSTLSSCPPLKLPKGRTKLPNDKDRPTVRPSGKHITHHRKPSSPDPTPISPSPGESPLSSRPPSPSPSLIASIEEKSRKILSKSGATSPNSMSLNTKAKLLPTPSANEIEMIKSNNSVSTSPSTSSTSVRSVVSPRQELKLSIVTDPSSSEMNLLGNLSSSNSSPVSGSSVPGTTTATTKTKPTSVSSSSSSASSSVTEAKCKGLILKKSKEPEETAETKKRSLTPNRPNNRSASPSLTVASTSSPSTPSSSNQVNSVGFESSKVDGSKKISPSSSISNIRSSSMPKSSTDKVKGSLNLPTSSKSSSASSKSATTNAMISNKVSTKNTVTSKSSSCPPTPTEPLPSYIVKTKVSTSAAKQSSEKQSLEKLIFPKSSGRIKSKAITKSSTDNICVNTESSSTPSSPQILQGAASSVNPIKLRLVRKSSTGSGESVVQQSTVPTKSSIKTNKSEKASDELKQSTDILEMSSRPTRRSTGMPNGAIADKGIKSSLESSEGKLDATDRSVKIQDVTSNVLKTRSSSESSPRDIDKKCDQSGSSLSAHKTNAKDEETQANAKSSIQPIVDKSGETSSKPEISGQESSDKRHIEEDEVNIVNAENSKKTLGEKADEMTSKVNGVQIDSRDEIDKNQINKQQTNSTKDGDQIKGLNKLLVNGNGEEPTITDIDTKKERKRIRFRPYTMDDFELRKVLGRGSFGKVYLAQLKGHDVFFAIKFLKKHVVIEDDDLESIMVERKVLALGVRHPFICKLFCTFQTRGMICFVMEFLAGGDLMFHVQSCGRFTEDRARFYAAEIVSALNFLHSRYIIYRDLKLDNILLDSEGHIRLVDFGMCQCHIWKEECLPSNFCGTPEYMAPEIIKGVQYNQAVDWWSFGVLIYEMIVGDSPFKATDEDELLWNVCYEKVRIPYFVSKNAQSIILNLLEYDPAERLGMPTSSKGDIRSHKFFETINWDAINSAKVKPPFVPNLKNQYDVCYFDREFTEMRAVLTPIDDYTVENVDHELFFGFDYTNPNMTD